MAQKQKLPTELEFLHFDFFLTHPRVLEIAGERSVREGALHV